MPCGKYPVLSAALAIMASGAAAQAQEVAGTAAELPDSFVAASPSEALANDNWWRSFGDAQLDALIERALAGNPSVAQAEARLRQARALARIEKAALLPQVSASLTGVDSGVKGPPAIPALLDLGVEVSWEADVWGRISAATAAARADARAREADLVAVRELVAAEVARTYFAAVEAQAQVDLSTRVLASYDELLRQLGLRVKAGVSPSSLQALTETDRQFANAGLEARREDYQRLIRRLEVLAGGYPRGDQPLASALAITPPAPATGVPAALLARRPDLLSARAAIEAAGLREKAAKKDFLPALTLTGSAGASASRFADLFDSSFGIWSIAGRLLQPVFQGGRLRAQLEFRRGERDEAIATFGDRALQALFEVESALAADSALAGQEVAFEASAEAAEEATRIANLRFRAGIESFFNLLESQQRALNARSAYLAARRARLANRIDLHLALGGGLAGGR